MREEEIKMNNKKTIQVAKILKAIANENRLKILYHIADKKLYVGEIEKLVGLSQSALSQHLAVLRAENLVKTRRKAQIIFYELKDVRVKKFLSLLQELF